MAGRIGEYLNEGMAGSKDVRMNRWMNRRTNVWVQQMKGWMNGWKVG